MWWKRWQNQCFCSQPWIHNSCKLLRSVPPSVSCSLCSVSSHLVQFNLAVCISMCYFCCCFASCSATLFWSLMRWQANILYVASGLTGEGSCLTGRSWRGRRHAAVEKHQDSSCTVIILIVAQENVRGQFQLHCERIYSLRTSFSKIDLLTGFTSGSRLAVW